LNVARSPRLDKLVASDVVFDAKTKLSAIQVSEWYPHIMSGNFEQTGPASLKMLNCAKLSGPPGAVQCH
jgi:hypothetical protein